MKFLAGPLELPGQVFLKIAVSAAPEYNKTNDALIKLLADRLGVAKRKITVVAGTNKPQKIVQIDTEERDCLDRLGQERK